MDGMILFFTPEPLNDTKNMRYVSYILLLAISLCDFAFAETQTTLSLTSQVYTPGVSSSFSASAVTGPTAAISGTVKDSYIGIRKFKLNDDGSGRFQGYGGETRYGVLFAEFQLFQTFLTPTFQSVVASSPSCPGGTADYNW